MVEGGFAYGYLFMAQHPDVEKVLQSFLSSTKPSRILEIGTFHGGLTLLLRDILDNIGLLNSPIWTYDIYDQEFLKPLVTDRNMQVYTTNLFNEDYTDWSDTSSQNSISNFIRETGRTLILCDGGCKKCEFNLIAPLLKENDIIMAHDYAPDSEYFEKYMKDKIWNWHEIQDNDIKEACDNYNLIHYHQEQLQKIAWLCVKKN